MSDSQPFEPENSLRTGFSAGVSVTYELNKAFSPYLKASYSRLSGDSAFRGVKSFNISTGLVF
jgi:predicted porin